MKKIQWLTVLCVVVIAMIAVLVAPKGAHAVAETPAPSTFQALFHASCDAPSFVSCPGLTIPTANGTGQAVSILVIEYISGSCSPNSLVPLTNYTVSELDTIFPPGGVPVLPPSAATSSTSGKFVQFVVTNSVGFFAQPVRLYAAAGTKLIMPDPSQANGCNLSISGFLVLV